MKRREATVTQRRRGVADSVNFLHNSAKGR